MKLSEVKWIEIEMFYSVKFPTLDWSGISQWLTIKSEKVHTGSRIPCDM